MLQNFYKSFTKIFEHNSIFVTTTLAGAFAFGIAFQTSTTKFWDNHNKGKLWKDIRSRYIEEDN